MVKKVLLLVAVGVLAGLGMSWYSAYRNTPERAAEGFVREIAEGKTEVAYNRLAADLTKGREQYWKDYLEQFKTNGRQPELVATEQVANTFNTYTDKNEPWRFTYTFHLKDKDYRLTVVVIKEDKTWEVASLYGAGVQ